MKYMLGGLSFPVSSAISSRSPAAATSAGEDAQVGQRETPEASERISGGLAVPGGCEDSATTGSCQAPGVPPLAEGIYKIATAGGAARRCDRGAGGSEQSSCLVSTSASDVPTSALPNCSMI